MGSQSRLLAILCFLTVVEIVAIDIYIPALPHLQQVLAVGASEVGLTMSIFLAALAVGQLIYGPLSDRFGRRRPMLIGFAVYTVGSLFPLLVPTYPGFLFARFLQALGAGAGLVIPRAMVSDCYDESDAGRAYSILMQVLGIAATLAPLLGGFLMTSYGWESIFYILSSFGVVCVALTLSSMPETLPMQRRVTGTWTRQLHDGTRLLRDRGFVCSGFALALSVASFFSVLTGSAFVFVEQFHWSLKSYTLLYGGAAFGFFITAGVNTWALKYRSELWLAWRALSLQAILSITLLVCSAMSYPSAVLAAALMVALFSNLGFILGNLNAIAMARARERAGSGASLLGVSQYSLSALGGVIPVAIEVSSPLSSVAISAFVLCSFASISFFIAIFSARTARASAA